MVAFNAKHKEVSHNSLTNYRELLSDWKEGNVRKLKASMIVVYKADIYIYIRGSSGVTATVVGYGHGNTSSNLRRGWFHFKKH